MAKWSDGVWRQYGGTFSSKARAEARLERYRATGAYKDYQFRVEAVPNS
jgi:hypothetical protein